LNVELRNVEDSVEYGKGEEGRGGAPMLFFLARFSIIFNFTTSTFNSEV
jgi:hypothetical protein